MRVRGESLAIAEESVLPQRVDTRLSESVRYPDVVYVPGGTCVLGDVSGRGFAQERPPRAVEVVSFWAGKYCVRVKEYLSFVQTQRGGFDELWCDFIDPCFIVKEGDHYIAAPGAENYPMVQVNFRGAVAYCNWLSCECGLEPVYEMETLAFDLKRGGFRLLLEAEWEYACGGPEGFVYGYGSRFDPSLVNFRDYVGAKAQERAAARRIGGFGLHPNSPLPVGSLPPTGFGLHEMLGNVNEWCHDVYAPYGDENAGSGPSSFRTIRGGSFCDGPEKMRRSYRHGLHIDAKCMIDGFRIARNAD